MNNNAWFAYLLLIPNNGISYTNYFKIAFSCYVEALKNKNVIKIKNHGDNDDETRKNTKYNKIEHFIKIFIDFARLSPNPKHHDNIKNNKDSIIKDLKSGKIDEKAYKYMNCHILRKYARSGNPHFFDKYDAITLLKKYFTLNFDKCPGLKVHFQDNEFLCQNDTKFKDDIVNDVSKVILLLSRLGSGKTIQLFRVINERKYKRVLFITSRIAFAYALYKQYLYQITT